LYISSDATFQAALIFSSAGLITSTSLLSYEDLGFTLAEIGELLSLSADRDVRGVKRRAEQRLEQVEHKINELQRVRRGLKTLIDACPGHGDLERCPIVAALSGEGER
jgi:MerR family copper efflux transcriptional regulator